MNNFLEISKNSEYKEKHKVVVRLTTEYWYDNDGCYTKKKLKFLKRKCKGYNFLFEECSNGGTEETIPLIINLYECKDGVYEVVTWTHHYDWETGLLDYWEYKLVNYQEHIDE